MREYIARISLITKNEKILFQKVDFNVDYGEDKIERFNKVYKNKINLNEEFKKVYPTFFHFNRYGFNLIDCSFEFGKFCNTYGITMEEYENMLANKTVNLPFPLVGSITVEYNNEELNCKFGVYTINSRVFLINFPENEKYFIKYDNFLYCELKLISDASEKEKEEYKNFCLNWVKK